MKMIGQPFQRPDRGGWWLRWTDPITKKRIKMSFPTERDADYHRSLLYQELNCNSFPPLIKTTLRKIVNEYLETYETRGLCPSSKTEARMTLDKFLELMNDVSTQYIGQRQLDYFVQYRSESGQSRYTINKDIANLQAFISWGTKQRYIAKGLFLNKVKVDKQLVKTPKTEQIQPILSETVNNYSITKWSLFWKFHYNGKDSMIPATLKGLKLLEILLTHPNKDYYPTQLLRNAEQPDTGTIQTATDDEFFENRLHIGDCVFKDDAEKIRERDRKSVERALDTVFRKIDNRELRNHFEQCIQTGVILRYKPDSSIRWIIQ